jgi:hypothetical protein
MHGWLSIRPQDARLGAISLVPIVLTLLLFPVIWLLGPAGEFASIVLGAICFMSFSAALLAAVLSLFIERSKLYGGSALLLAVLMLYFQPMYLYFIIPMEIYLPLAVVGLAVFGALRLWRKKRHATLAPESQAR